MVALSNAMHSFTTYVTASTVLSFTYALTSHEAQTAPSVLSLTLLPMRTSAGQLALLNAFIAVTAGGIRLLQYFVFGSLRVAEWQ